MPDPTDFADQDDFGGLMSDGEDFRGDEGSAGEGQSPSPSSAAKAGEGEGGSRSTDQPEETVLLYDVVRSKRVDELLKCFDQEPPYKPVQVSLDDRCIGSCNRCARSLILQ